MRKPAEELGDRHDCVVARETVKVSGKRYLRRTI